MPSLKDLFMEIDSAISEENGDNSLEVYADSVKQALELAAKELNVDISALDYEIVEKGTKGFFGIGRLPYRVIVTPIKLSTVEMTELDELDSKFSGSHIPGISLQKEDSDGIYKIRVTKNGVMLKVIPPRGNGAKVAPESVENKLYEMRISKFDKSAIAKAVKNARSEWIKVGDWVPNPNYDGTLRVEVTDDEMKAYVYFNPPRFNGRHMDYDDVIEALRNAGVVTGIKEKEINDYLEEMDYRRPLLAAEGQYPRNGRDAYIEYKVRVDKSRVQFEEDDSGKVDFRNLELLENVVAGQLLAVKVPAEEGIPGRTITNRVIPAKSGKDTSIKYGKGTILSEDGTELTAEINGQVVFKLGRISVEPVYVVGGDVSLETGNIVFLGSVIVQGSVLDNFEVKAAGNVEVKGTVQKANIEAEGDIIVHQGISGKEEARVESTGGSIFAKFVQNSNLIAEKNVVVPEGILHSNVDAGEKIYSIGRRAKIAGGVIRAGDEVNARFLGAEGATRTIIRVGINPKILQQMDDLQKIKDELENELTKLRLDIKTLTTQKRNAGGKLADEKEKLLTEMTEREAKQSERFDEVNSELEELNSYISMLEHKGKVCAERIAYPGVEIYIKDKDFKIRDNYTHVTFKLEGGEIHISDYEPPDLSEGTQKITTLVRRRR
ncbi:MAG TPA: FapA family protein [Spirochaetota bacterium]|nr:FapA family protein [Spirochaetota bacterium]HOV08577.1 FapA family protein [Spirochaetota bacterium]HPD79134.1 FapA family protein [Spirochaetota bacterium]